MDFIQRQHAFVKFLIYLVIVFFGGLFLSIILGLIFSRGDVVEDWIFSMAYILAIVVTAILAVVSEHNLLFGLREKALSIRKDILAVQSRTENVLFQLENIMMVHMSHEREIYVQKDISYEKDKESKGRHKKLRTMAEVRNSITQFPELGSDDDVMRMFDEIVRCQNQLMNQKTTYNNIASQYNAGIQKAMAKMFRKKWKLEKLAYYEESSDILVDSTLECEN